MKHPDLYAIFDRLERLEKLKSPLDGFDQFIDWEIYREMLSSLYTHNQGKGGRPPYDPVMMFKVIFLQKIYTLSDDEMEFHILDRLSFQKFLKINPGDSIPDSKTIWFFRERLSEANMYKDLFNKLDYWIKKQGKIFKNGSSIDGSIVDAPIQRNSRAENEKIKNGEIPEDWKDKANKLAQKDTDADWKVKNGKSSFGYANHIIINNDSKLITDFDVTKASVHDSQPAPDLINRMEPNQKLYADSAYHSEKIREAMIKNNIEACIIEKKKKGSKLTKFSIKRNRKKSKTRARVEHVFADIHSFGGDMLRTIGIERAKLQIALSNIAYNIRRYTYLAQV